MGLCWDNGKYNGNFYFIGMKTDNSPKFGCPYAKASGLGYYRV